VAVISRSSSPRAKKLAAVAFLAATAMGLMWSLVLYFGLRGVGRPLTVAESLSGFGDWYLWVMISPLIVWVARRLPLDTERPWPRLWLHLVLGIVVALIELAAFTAYSTWYNLVVLGYPSLPSFADRYIETTARWLPFAFLMYVVIVAAVHAIEYHRRYRQRELATAILEAQLTRAKMEALEMQLHPHFLFNTLNTIATAAREREADRAADMIVGLAELLRMALDHSGEQEVPLEEELDFIRRYLELERERFGSRLQVEFQVSAEARTALVPVMVLQPLVENAMQHAVAPRARGGRIEISARRAADILLLGVTDDGPGIPPQTQESPSGVGLSNTRSRLDVLYGGGASLDLGRSAAGGLAVTVSLPWNPSNRSPWIQGPA
jgi:signal transduction histidine kinase